MIFSRFKISGHSMEPKFKEGDRVIVWGKCMLKKNDVIVFKQRGITYLKRILDITPAGFIVKGDNEGHSATLGPVQRSDVFGRVLLKY